MKSVRAGMLRVLVPMTAGAAVLQFGGCDPTIRATVEDGVIDVVTALFASLLQAAFQVATEDAMA